MKQPVLRRSSSQQQLRGTAITIHQHQQPPSSPQLSTCSSNSNDNDLSRTESNRSPPRSTHELRHATPVPSFETPTSHESMSSLEGRRRRPISTTSDASTTSADSTPTPPLLRSVSSTWWSPTPADEARATQREQQLRRAAEYGAQLLQTQKGLLARIALLEEENAVLHGVCRPQHHHSYYQQQQSQQQYQ